MIEENAKYKFIADYLRKDTTKYSKMTKFIYDLDAFYNNLPERDKISNSRYKDYLDLCTSLKDGINQLIHAIAEMPYLEIVIKDTTNRKDLIDKIVAVLDKIDKKQ